MGTPLVSLLISYSGNAAKIAKLLARIESTRATGVMIGWEVVLVNYGSLTGVSTVLNGLISRYQWVRVVHHYSHRGASAAIRTGLKHVHAPFICTVDSDANFLPENLPVMIEMLRDGADLVTATPSWNAEDNTCLGIQGLLQCAAGVFYKLVHGSTMQSFVPIHRAYRRSLVERIHSRSASSFVVGEIMVQGRFHGFRVKEAPVEPQVCSFDGSAITIFDSILGHMCLLRMTAGMAGGGWMRQQMPWSRVAIEE